MAGGTPLVTLLQEARTVRGEQVSAVTRPAVIVREQGQRKQRVDVRARPAHPGPLHTGLHHLLVAALRRAAADRPARCTEDRVVQVGDALTKGGDPRRHRRRGRLRPRPARQDREHARRPFRPPPAPQAFGDPPGTGRLHAKDRFGQGREVLGGMRPVEDA